MVEIIWTSPALNEINEIAISNLSGCKKIGSNYA